MCVCASPPSLREGRLLLAPRQLQTVPLLARVTHASVSSQVRLRREGRRRSCLAAGKSEASRGCFAHGGGEELPGLLLPAASAAGPEAPPLLLLGAAGAQRAAAAAAST